MPVLFEPAEVMINPQIDRGVTPLNSTCWSQVPFCSGKGPKDSGNAVEHSTKIRPELMLRYEWPEALGPVKLAPTGQKIVHKRLLASTTVREQALHASRLSMG